MSITAPHENTEVAQYLADVAHHLESLPAHERADLLDDLAQHLAEVAAEPGPPLAERLGAPADYAAELLASVGITPEPTVPSPKERLLAAVNVVRTHPLVQRATAFTLDLRSAWWVGRGWLAAWFVSEVVSDTSRPWAALVPRPQDNALMGIVLTVALVVASVALGRRTPSLPRWQRYALVAGGVGLVLFGFVLMARFDARADARRIVYQNPPASAPDGCLRNGRGRPVQNIYAYDADGKPLDRVVLYDDTGRPINNLCLRNVDEDGFPVVTEYATDANGNRVVNVFPRKQTRVPQDPYPGQTAPAPGPLPPPAIVPPKLATTTTTSTTTLTTTTSTTSTTTP